MLLLDAADIEQSLPMADALDLMESAFRCISAGTAETAPRQSLPLAHGQALLMGATMPGMGTLAKVVSVIPGNRDHDLPVSIGTALLMSEETGEANAAFDATALTAWRTGALAGCATRLLAGSTARSALLIGSGTQARTQLLALDCAFRLDEIHVVSRHSGRARDFVATMQPHIRAHLSWNESTTAIAGDVDIIISATTSTSPVVPGRRVRDGCHITGVGSFRPDMIEFDAELIGKSAVFVESRETALEEAGELLAARKAGTTREADWREVGEVFTSTVAGRENDEQVTFFKSVGHALFDLTMAAELHRRATVAGLGTRWPANGHAASE